MTHPLPRFQGSASLIVGWALLLLLAACGDGQRPAAVATTPRPADPMATALPTGPSPALSPTTAAAGEPTPTPAPTQSAGPARPTLLGTFPSDLAEEVSGIAASALDPDALWLIDDGPGTTGVVAISATGTHLGITTMAGVEGRDTEALSLASCGAGADQHCLYVGDIGDNSAQRDQIRVHRFVEPEPAGDRTVDVTTATFTYPDGPRNAEAMVVGPDGLPVVFSKEDGRVGVYRATAFADGVLESLEDLPLPDPSTPFLSLFTGVLVTDASLSPDGRDLLVRTYDHAVRFTAPDGPADLAGVSTWPATEVPVAIEPQGEAITWASPSGRQRGYVTASEGTGSLWFVAAP